jgi:hypothetical protein
MSKHTSQHFSPRASLCTLGPKIRSLKLFDTISNHVFIKQKTIKHKPVDKLLDAFIVILAGAHGLCEINTRLRSDPALQRAFGRSGCAEQSVVQETLNACSETNISQMRQAFNEILRQYSRAFSHNYRRTWQLLDIDLTGLPCGKKAELSHKGYFSKAGIRYGRQLGRVVATLYQEIISDQLYSGNALLSHALRPLIIAAEEVPTTPTPESLLPSTPAPESLLPSTPAPFLKETPLTPVTELSPRTPMRSPNPRTPVALLPPSTPIASAPSPLPLTPTRPCPKTPIELPGAP